LNPTSFVLRNLRWGRYEGLPPAVVDLLCLFVLGSSLLIVMTAAIGAVTADGLMGAATERAAGAAGGDARAQIVATWALTLYHLAACGALIGMSRFRVPLVPLWIPFSAMVLGFPGPTLAALQRSPARTFAAALLLMLVGILSLVFLPRAFPQGAA
jgi:hypothetical protein